jgi:lysophospholipase L1-like esterase
MCAVERNSINNEVRPLGVEDFIRGAAWPAGEGVTYPRANPSDFDRLPIDTWSSASFPIGVRLEVSGDARFVDIEYHTATNEPGYRGGNVGTTFSVWRNGEEVDEQPAVLGGESVRLDLGTSEGHHRSIIYLPERMKPSIRSLRGIDGDIFPADQQPRWISYGDSIVEGWNATTPARSWTAMTGRNLGLNVYNLGYAGSARGEIVTALHIGELRADVVSLAFGTNCWSRVPHTAEQLAANTTAFVRVVRASHPGTPIIIMSPLVRVDAEQSKNAVGATLSDLRRAMEDATLRLVESGDDLLSLLPGRDEVPEDLLTDGIHPNDDGHLLLARTFGNAISQQLRG